MSTALERTQSTLRGTVRYDGRQRHVSEETPSRSSAERPRIPIHSRRYYYRLWTLGSLRRPGHKRAGGGDAKNPLAEPW